MQTHLEHALHASRMAEAELRERERRLEISLQAANVGTWDWDIRTGDVRWSETLERIHGQKPGAFLGTFAGFLTTIHADDRQRVLDAIGRAQAGTDAYEVEYRSLLPDGTVRWFEGRGHVIRDQSGRPVGMSGICMDTTERHRFQEQLRQTQRLESLGLLAGGIAHDFNNLLAGILGNASLAFDALPADSKPAAMLREVIGGCERAAALTRRLLAYAGKDHPTIAPTNLNVLVQELYSFLRTSIPKLVNLSLQMEDDLPCVLGDPAQLQQVVMNLVINGAEAIPERTAGEVTVTTRRRPLDPSDYQRAVIPVQIAETEYVEVSVRDNGLGMDSGIQARIFDPFYTTKFTGRGLGLSAVLGIVRGHGGTITVHSAPGEGTCFSVLLPAAPFPAPVKPPDTAPRVERGSGTILVVDDEPAIREMVKRALESNGYDVLVAGDGRAAIQQVSETPEIRAVLLDFAMPEMSGDAAAARMRSIRPDLPIVLSSGYAKTEATLAFTESAYSAFLEKPYTTWRMLETLAQLLCRVESSGVERRQK